jgi:hypothetical protein
VLLRVYTGAAGISKLEIASYRQAAMRKQDLRAKASDKGVRPTRAVVDGVEDELDAGRDPELVKDAEEVFFDGVLAQVQFAGGFAIAEASGYEGNNLLLAGGEKFAPGGIDDPQGWNFGDEIEQEAHLLGVNPNLTFGDALDTPAEQAKVSVRGTENSTDARAEGANDQFAIVGFEQENFGHVRMKKMDAAKR